jgi:hypothetical protein
MGFDLSSMIGGSIGDAFSKIVGAFKVNPTEALAAQTELAKIQLELQAKILDQVSAQLDVNKVEAASTSIFVAGWRPFIGWICGTGLAVQFIIGPISTWAASLLGHPIQFPSLDLGTLMTLLLGMLGLGTMRTYEKTNGVNSGH